MNQKICKWKNTHPLVMGTAVLTATGLCSRLIGFFYRIYLARLFGEEGMGIYQLIGPVTSLTFSLTAAGFQTAISRLVAENTVKQTTRDHTPLFVGLCISLPLSLLCNLAIFSYADTIAVVFLSEERTAPLLRILSFSVPLSAVHACINGYFYGKKKTLVPAVSQLTEQLLRVGCVFLITWQGVQQGVAPTISVAVFGLVVGELGSALVNIVAALVTFGGGERAVHCLNLRKQSGTAGTLRPLLAMTIPVAANRITLNLLQSLETISLPLRLRMYGYDNATALSVYGVLTGMALPLIFFPNALTNSLSILLLPMISEAYVAQDLVSVEKYIQRTVRYCIAMGCSCTIAFLLMGKWIGQTLFQSELAGHFIVTLGFLCPFLYLDTALSGVLQGLGMVSRLFFFNVFCLLLRLFFVFLMVPRYGITGYLWGMLAGQISLSVLYLVSLNYLRTGKKRKD